MEEVTKHYLISGRVQGVGFRAFAQHAGQVMGLKGWVRNLWDGRVEAVARGGIETLTAFESKLRTGPKRAFVQSISVSDLKSAPAGADFEVREDGKEPASNP
jgi:acylphosphatase